MDLIEIVIWALMAGILVLTIGLILVPFVDRIIEWIEKNVMDE